MLVTKRPYRSQRVNAVSSLTLLFWPRTDALNLGSHSGLGAFLRAVPGTEQDPLRGLCSFWFVNLLFIYLFVFGCVGSSLLRTGFL